MLQKGTKTYLFAFKTSPLRFLSASAPLLLRSAKFCTFATDGMGVPISVPVSASGITAHPDFIT